MTANRLLSLLLGTQLLLGLALVGVVTPMSTSAVAGALPPPTTVAAPSATILPAYTIEATLDVDGGRLAARQLVRFTNTSGKSLESIVFNASPGSWGGFSVEASAVDVRPTPVRLN